MRKLAFAVVGVVQEEARAGGGGHGAGARPLPRGCFRQLRREWRRRRPPSPAVRDDLSGWGVHHDRTPPAPPSCTIGSSTAAVPMMILNSTAAAIACAVHRVARTACSKERGACGRAPRTNERPVQASTKNCVPKCRPDINGDELLLNIDGDDTRMTCELHRTLYSAPAPPRPAACPLAWQDRFRHGRSHRGLSGRFAQAGSALRATVALSGRTSRRSSRR